VGVAITVGHAGGDRTARTATANGVTVSGRTTAIATANSVKAPGRSGRGARCALRSLPRRFAPRAARC